MIDQGFFEKTELLVSILTLNSAHSVKNKAQVGKNKKLYYSVLWRISTESCEGQGSKRAVFCAK